MATQKKYFIEQNGNRVKFGPVDTSYMHVVERWTPAGADKGFYSCWLLIPKGATDIVDAVQRGIDAAIADGISKKWDGKRPKKLESPLRDGADEEDTDFHGFYILNAKAKEHRPGLGKLVNGAVKSDDFATVDDWYSGNRVIASVTFFPYKAMSNTGVGCGLDSLLQIEKGERKAGSPSFEKDFGNTDFSGFGFGGDADDNEL